MAMRYYTMLVNVTVLISDANVTEIGTVSNVSFEK